MAPQLSGIGKVDKNEALRPDVLDDVEETLKVDPQKKDYSGAHEKTDPREIALVRKLDWYIMPILWLMYWLNYLVRAQNCSLTAVSIIECLLYWSAGLTRGSIQHIHLLTSPA